ncbi:MAG: hypothetical protein ACP5H2_06725 [Solirubrobacteraceae bacterium]
MSLPATPDTRTLIEATIERFFEEVPGLRPLKIVAGIELHGRGDVQLYRIELPGPRVTKTLPTDAKVTLEVRRDRFNELAAKGHVADWRTAFERGEVKATGVDQYLKLIVKVVEAQEQRKGLRRTRR